MRATALTETGPVDDLRRDATVTPADRSKPQEAPHTNWTKTRGPVTYIYVGDDPVNYLDPNGMSFFGDIENAFNEALNYVEDTSSYLYRRYSVYLAACLEGASQETEAGGAGLEEAPARLKLLFALHGCVKGILTFGEE